MFLEMKPIRSSGTGTVVKPASVCAIQHVARKSKIKCSMSKAERTSSKISDAHNVLVLTSRKIKSLIVATIVTECVVIFTNHLRTIISLMTFCKYFRLYCTCITKVTCQQLQKYMQFFAFIMQVWTKLSTTKNCRSYLEPKQKMISKIWWITAKHTSNSRRRLKTQVLTRWNYANVKRQ